MLRFNRSIQMGSPVKPENDGKELLAILLVVRPASPQTVRR
jgi:hypothetical protein